MKKNVVEFLCDNYDVIAYNPIDMKEVGRDVIEP